MGIAVNVMGSDQDPNETWASIEDSSLTMTGGTLKVEATNEDPDMDPRIIAITGSLGIGSGPESVAGAGTISVNLIHNDTRASVRRSTITEAYVGPDTEVLDTQVTARDNSGIVTISGAVGLAQEKSLGAAVSYNEIENVLSASFEDVVLTADGSLTLDASSEGLIRGITVGVAASTSSGSFAGAGSLSINKISNLIDAHILKTIDGTSTISIGGNLGLKAADKSQIVSISGGVAGSHGKAVGAAISYNLIQNRVFATIEGAEVVVGDPLNWEDESIALSATSSASLIAFAVGGAAAQDFAFGGSLSVNAIANTLDAHITETPHVSATGDIILTASGSNKMLVVAGGVGLSTHKSAVGAAFAYNYIGGSFNPANPNLVDENSAASNQISAYIDNADVEAGGDIYLVAGYHPATEWLVMPELPELALSDSQVSDFAEGLYLELLSHGSVQNGTFVLDEDGIAFFRDQAVIVLEVQEPTDGEVQAYASDLYTLLTENGSLQDDTFILNEDYNPRIRDLASYFELNLYILDVNETRILSICVGGAGAGKFALGGAVSINIIRNSIEVKIVNSTVTASSVILATADKATIEALAGGVAGAGKTAIGAALATNDIANTIQAYIDNSVVTGTNLSVIAES
ncbi:MAG: hypothetical protein MUP44_08130, partial [Anaerolineales bacterium]|nr:hypothetical protein [Anaerolineales bacterium]